MNNWSTKTDFSDISTVGYLCDDGEVISGQILRKTEAKIFVNFGQKVETFGHAYSWIDIPNDRLCPAPLISPIKKHSEKRKKKHCNMSIKPEVPIEFKYYTNPVRISNIEFVIAIPSSKQLIKYNIRSKQWSELFNYNANKDRKLGDWTKRTNFQQLENVGYLLDDGDIITGELIKVSKDKIFLHFNINEAAPFKYSWINVPNKRLSAPKGISKDQNAKLYYDEINDEYYIYHKPLLTMINIKNNTAELISGCPSNVVYDSNTRLVQGQFHFVSATLGYCYHNIFDPKTKAMETNFVCSNFDKLIHIPSKHMLLLFGKAGTWYYSLKDKLLTNSATLGGINITNYNVFLTNNQQYVLIFNDDGINYYLDLNTMKVSKINIEWDNPQYVIMMGNHAKLITSIYGFTRNVWRMNDMESLFPSDDILGLIVLFGRSDFIHLLKNRRHSTINIIDVIPSYYSLEMN